MPLRARPLTPRFKVARLSRLRTVARSVSRSAPVRSSASTSRRARCCASGLASSDETSAPTAVSSSPSNPRMRSHRVISCSTMGIASRRQASTAAMLSLTGRPLTSSAVVMSSPSAASRVRPSGTAAGSDSARSGRPPPATRANPGAVLVLTCCGSGSPSRPHPPPHPLEQDNQGHQAVGAVRRSGQLLQQHSGERGERRVRRCIRAPGSGTGRHHVRAFDVDLLHHPSIGRHRGQRDPCRAAAVTAVQDHHLHGRETVPDQVGDLRIGHRGPRLVRVATSDRQM